MKLEKILGIKYPIIQGGMADISNGKFAAEVSESGALGIIAASSMNEEELREEIKTCKSLTKKPFGVNLMLLNSNIDKMVEVIIEEKVPIVTTGAGNPSKYIKEFHKAGIKVFPVVPNPTLASKMEKAGVDGVIVEGNEAGGHIGDMTSMTLILQTKEKVNIPIIAAGGIASGKQMLAAKVLGAVGVQIGSLFLSALECPIHEKYKKLMLESEHDKVTVIGRREGLPLRVLKNNMTKKYLQMEKENRDKGELEKYSEKAWKLARELGDVEEGSFIVGLTVSQIKDIKPVKEILEELMKDYQNEMEKIYDEFK